VELFAVCESIVNAFRIVVHGTEFATGGVPFSSIGSRDCADESQGRIRMRDPIDIATEFTLQWLQGVFEGKPQRILEVGRDGPGPCRGLRVGVDR
jgi:hypothetical protein